MEIIEILHFSNFSSIGEMVRLHGESILGNPSNKERDKKISSLQSAVFTSAITVFRNKRKCLKNMRKRKKHCHIEKLSKKRAMLN